jgi:hypothetical protein
LQHAEGREGALLAQQTPGLRSQKLLLPPEVLLPDEPDEPDVPDDVPPAESPPIVAPPEPVELDPDVEPVDPDVDAPPVLPDEPLVVPLEVEPDEVDEDVAGVVGVVSVGVVEAASSSAVSVAGAVWPVGGTRSGLEDGSAATLALPPPQLASAESAASRATMEARGLIAMLSRRAPTCGGRTWGTR